MALKLYGVSLDGCTENEEVIDIPDNVMCVSQDAFKDCSFIKNVIFKPGVTLIGENAFENCTGLTEITLQNVHTICESAFAGCTSLTTINILNSSPTISKYAFKDCTSLKTVNISKGASSIDETAFENCPLINKDELKVNKQDIFDFGFHGTKEQYTFLDDDYEDDDDEIDFDDDDLLDGKDFPL